MTEWTCQKWLKALRFTLKSEFWLWIWQSRFTFLVINVTFWAISDIFILSFWQSPLVSQCLWGCLFALYHFRYPPNWQIEHLRIGPKRYLLTIKKSFPVVRIDHKNQIFIDKRNVLGQFCDVHFVISAFSIWQCLWGWLSALYHFRCPVCIFDCKVACNRNTFET